VECAVDGTTVSWLVVHDLRWHVGSALVRMGGIGGVGTLKAHRNRGYSRLCMDEAVALMDRERVPMAALFGIPNFYSKWGFAPVIPEPWLKLDAADAARAEPDPRFRVVRFQDRLHQPAALTLIRRNDRLRSGSVVTVRPREGTDSWLWRSRVRHGSDWGIRAEGFAVLDRKRTLAGYAAHDRTSKAMRVVEVGYRSPAVFGAVTRELARRARARRVAQLELMLPLDHPYVLYLRRWNVHHRLSYYANGQGMGRIVRLEDTLRACAPELTRRLAGSRFHRANASVGFATEIGAATAVVRGGRVSVRPGLAGRDRIRVPQPVLTQWLLGYRPVAPSGIAIPARVLPLLSAFFPSGFPFIWRADRF